MKVLKETQFFVRYQQHNEKVYYGIVEDDEIKQITSNFTELVNNELKYDGERVKCKDVNILEPVVPAKIINYGWTYAKHATETGRKPNLKEPLLFVNPLSSLMPTKGAINVHPS